MGGDAHHILLKVTRVTAFNKASSALTTTLKNQQSLQIDRQPLLEWHDCLNSILEVNSLNHIVSQQIPEEDLLSKEKIVDSLLDLNAEFRANFRKRFELGSS